MLFAGKPCIYERLGFRVLGDFPEVTDQIASRIVMKRDLTERTRGGGSNSASRETKGPTMKTGKRQMQKTCEVCGSQKMLTEDTGVGTMLKCKRCGSRFDYYYRQDGGLLDYPVSWGKVIDVIYEPTGSYKNRCKDGALDMSCEGDFYYVFVADDGTIRRARIADHGHFDDKTPRPKCVPKSVEGYHAWVVDVLPPGAAPQRSE